MNAITNWQLSMAGLGSVQLYTAEFYYAGGLAVIGFGDGGGTGFEIFSLGNSEIALMTSRVDQQHQTHDFYWNSHYGTSNGSRNGGMNVWSDQDHYESGSIGPEQKFKLINLGGGNVALQATAGAFPGAYLGGMRGGWYPNEWSLGDGSFLSVSNPAALQVRGDMLPILQITNSGYELNLAKRSLAGTNLANANMQRCNLSDADLSKIGGLQGANFTEANLSSASLAGQDLAGANWTQADFSHSDLSTIAGAAGAEMPRAVFDSANLRGRTFAKAQLAGASFKSTTLDQADFSGADLTGANLAGASLKGTNFRGAKLQGAHFDHSDLSPRRSSIAPRRSPARQRHARRSLARPCPLRYWPATGRIWI